METPNGTPTLHLVNNEPAVAYGPRLDGELFDAPFYVCGGMRAPYRVLRLVETSAPSEESGSPDGK